MSNRSNKSNNKLTAQELYETIHTSYNLRLLATHLSKKFGKAKAQQLMTQYTEKSNQSNHDYLFGANSLAYELGRRDMTFFALYYLQDTFVPKSDNDVATLAPFHYELWDNLQSLYDEDDFNNFLAILPRGSGKTAVADFALSTWANAYKHSYYTLVAGATQSDAEQFIAQIRSAFEENIYIKHSFGELIKPRQRIVNKQEIVLDNDTKIEAISSTGSMRGKTHIAQGKRIRPQLVITDDFQTKADVTTQEARNKKYDTFMADLKYIGSRSVERDDKQVIGTKFVALGTILHRDCLISRLIKNPTYSKFIKKGILVDDVDKLFNSDLWAEFKRILYNHADDHALENAKEFYYQNESAMQYPRLWESYWSCLDLALDYYEDPTTFKREVQNDASKIGERAFHQIKTLPREEIEQQDFTHTILCADPAVEVGKNNDYTALLVGSKTNNEFRWVRKGTVQKVKFDDYIKAMIDLLHEYDDISHIWIEKNTYNGADVRELEKQIEADYTLSRRNIKILNERQHKNKENKIRAISSKVDSGFFVFAEEDTEFTNQILHYEGEGYSLNDDAPDVTAEFDRLIDELSQETQSISFLPKGIL